jgi:hypothetical protein
VWRAWNREHPDKGCMVIGFPYAPGSTVIIAEPLVKGSDGLVRYASDGALALRDGQPVAWPWKVKSLSGRYMPNWAARSWGTIVSARVERLQGITEEDAIREGASPIGGLRPSFSMDGKYYHDTARAAFADYINVVNGPGTWQSNPFVFRYELEKLAEAPHE